MVEAQASRPLKGQGFAVGIVVALKPHKGLGRETERYTVDTNVLRCGGLFWAWEKDGNSTFGCLDRPSWFVLLPSGCIHFFLSGKCFGSKVSVGEH